MVVCVCVCVCVCVEKLGFNSVIYMDQNEFLILFKLPRISMPRIILSMSNLCIYFSKGVYIYGLGLGPMHLMHWIRSDGNMCPKVDIYHYFNGSSTTKHWN